MDQQRSNEMKQSSLQEFSLFLIIIGGLFVCMGVEYIGIDNMGPN